LFFTVYLISGLALYGDYGMSWDEALQRQHGFVSAEYVNQKFELQDKQYDWRQLHEYMYRYHGVWFTLPMAWLEEAWELNTFRQQFRMRHLSVFLLYWFAGITFFSLLRSRFGHWGWALLGSAFWLLSPRFFAHAFFNPKDIPFLSLFVISTWTLFRLWLRPGIRTALLHAFVCGMLIGMRIIGILMPVMTIFLFVADAFVGRKGTRPSGIARSLGIGSYLPLVFGFTVVFWPYLWPKPLVKFAEAFDIMSQYGWGGKVLFRGQFYGGEEIPWSYIPEWIGITTPVLYLILAIAGFTGLLIRTWANLKERPFSIWATSADRKDWASFGLVLAPILAIIVLDSVVYDGWRHLFFVYPSLLYLAVLGTKSIWDWSKGRGIWRKALIAGLSLQGLYLSVWMLINHPHQNVFFNAFVWGNQLGQYDLDYWGNSYKQGFEALAKLDENPIIKVAYQSYPATLNYEYLHPELRSRFQLTENPEEADYFLSDFRVWRMELDQALNREGFYKGEEVHAVYAGQSKIFGIYRLRKN
ncbi:MAG: hypothetical protein KI786_12545, partial [Mameliella sp.]|nr:hypothetical protein [Phaeodactylibacter sp.]